MPDFAVHTLFGEDVLPLAQVQSMVAGEQELPAFYWGLQGPDPLFFRSEVSPLGGRMHRERVGELLFHLADLLCTKEPGAERDTATAWFAGFLCHYALDRQLHPYVYARQRELAPRFPGKSPSALHYQIETDLDQDFYLLRRHQPVARMDPAQGYGLAPWQKQTLGSLISVALYQTYGAGVTTDQVVRSMDAMSAAQQLIFRGGKPIHLLAQGLELVLGKKGEYTGHIKAYRPQWDSLNLNHTPWAVPRTGETSTQSVPELVELARDAAAALLGEYGAMLAAGRAEYLPQELDFAGDKIKEEPHED